MLIHRSEPCAHVLSWTEVLWNLFHKMSSPPFLVVDRLHRHCHSHRCQLTKRLGGCWGLAYAFMRSYTLILLSFTFLRQLATQAPGAVVSSQDLGQPPLPQVLPPPVGRSSANSGPVWRQHNDQSVGLGSGKPKYKFLLCYRRMVGDSQPHLLNRSCFEDGTEDRRMM